MRPNSWTSIRVHNVSYSEADISSKVSIEDGVLRIVVATEAGGASLDLEGIEEGTSTLRSVGRADTRLDPVGLS